jgi:hypothetical protein
MPELMPLYLGKNPYRGSQPFFFAIGTTCALFQVRCLHLAFVDLIGNMEGARVRTDKDKTGRQPTDDRQTGKDEERPNKFGRERERERQRQAAARLSARKSD